MCVGAGDPEVRTRRPVTNPSGQPVTFIYGSCKKEPAVTFHCALLARQRDLISRGPVSTWGAGALQPAGQAAGLPEASRADGAPVIGGVPTPTPLGWHSIPPVPVRGIRFQAEAKPE